MEQAQQGSTQPKMLTKAQVEEVIKAADDRDTWRCSSPGCDYVVGIKTRNSQGWIEGITLLFSIEPVLATLWVKLPPKMLETECFRCRKRLRVLVNASSQATA